MKTHAVVYPLTHEQAPVRGSVDGDATGDGVLFPDQKLGCRLEVIEALLLVPQCAAYSYRKKKKVFAVMQQL